ncbi:SPla/RYanodine receptor subgroup [Neofusicoccum parvum]|uniref:SPla/RYanodine receptor subgroup n=1 Tax=Neofusicoccum parvum TaxID=310453 RepID=A0ACB5RRP2_9PEZI|nr:SPla/RYanodine receptor subgroup [Neofusicoccum parvum]
MPSWNPFKKEKQQQPQEEHYAPPPGPPPNYAQQQNPGYGYGYSTAAASSSGGYAPPPGPPPSHNPNNPFVDNTKKQDPYIDYSNQPPSQLSPPPAEPPAYAPHDWTVIPDTALLPPPPPMNNDTSPTANASAESGESAFRWCNAHPLRPPHAHSPAQLSALAFGRVALAPPPPSFTGELRPHASSPGRYAARTASGCGDACLATALPLYAAAAHAPALTGRPKTAYFELRVNGVGGMPGTSAGSLEEADAGIAVGFVAQPFPAWRLPGWQRGSLGVHGDDGRRYVNDTFGGVDFTTAFAPGETVGIGVTWSLPRNPPAYGGGGGGGGAPRLDAEVFFTRDGKRKGGWDLHEELDERAIGGTVGLDGDYDVYGAVGVFGGVDFEVFFNQADWLYRPEHV